MACWEHLAAMLPRSPSPLSKVSQAGPRARKTLRFQVDNKSERGSKREKGFLKLKERSGNVFENKGSAFHRPSQSGNIIENKGSYASKAEMLLKIKVVSRW
jgi:hypothetical protein